MWILVVLFWVKHTYPHNHCVPYVIRAKRHLSPFHSPGNQDQGGQGTWLSSHDWYQLQSRVKPLAAFLSSLSFPLRPSVYFFYSKQATSLAMAPCLHQCFNQSVSAQFSGQLLHRKARPDVSEGRYLFQI